MVRTLELPIWKLRALDQPSTDAMVRTREALIWKLRATKVRPFGHDSIQERISAKFGKSIAQLSVQTPYVYRLNDAQVFQVRCSFEPAAYK
jgi:hypothetical protein